MSVRLLSAVFQCNMPELKTDKGKTVPDSTAKFILLALADHANDEGEGSYPSIRRLCKKTNLSTATICNALNALRFNGFISLVGKSKVDTNNYTILVAKILEFQWLESSDSSGWNRGVLATEIKPSINHQNQPSERQPPPDFRNLEFKQIMALPEIALFREITGRIPGKPQYAIIWEVIHSNQFTKAYLTQFWKEWATRGHRSENISWLTDWAVAGKIPQKSDHKREEASSPQPVINYTALRLAQEAAEYDQR